MKDEEVVERMNDAFENGMNEYRKHCDEFSPHECVIQGMTGALKVAREGCYTEARDEYWRGALAAKDQTIASLQLRMDGCIAINQSAAAEIVELREHVAARIKRLEQLLGAPDAGKRRSDVSQN